MLPKTRTLDAEKQYHVGKSGIRLDTNLKHNSNNMLNPHQNSAEKHHVRIKEL